jgi:hypothetical protein
VNNTGFFVKYYKERFMKRVLIFLTLLFTFFSYSFSQQTIDLSDLKDTKETQKKSTDTVKGVKKEDKKTKEKQINKKIDKNKKKNSNNKSSKTVKKKKIVKKNDKSYKYKFQKKDLEIYKFDEKGNPVIPSNKVKKSTTVKEKNDLSLGIDDKSVNAKSEGN